MSERSFRVCLSLARHIKFSGVNPMEPSKVAWGIEVGEFALKAIRLALVGDTINVTDFAVIPHQKVLSDPSVSDREGMIRVTLGAFVQSHAEQMATEPIIMSLPGNAGFARFATIPAVDAKTLRSMIEYEAKQQIPFPIEEVEWDSYVLPADDSGQCSIGIFAVTKERLHELLALYAECGIEPDVLTLSSVAGYNALHYDLELEDNPEPISCIDIGTNSSDLIVIANGKFWIRTFPIGGSQFTSAIAETFASQNVNYTRAEKIKLDRAPSEKILRARTMAMRRVTGQLVDEIGRSREFYQSANEDVELKRAYGVGSTLKISGLRTKIAGDLQMTVDRLEEFKRIHLNGPDAADFAAHSINLLTALGLAIQGLGLAKVELNLSPMAQIRQKIWKAKTPWFIAAASLLFLTSIVLFLRVGLDQIQIAKMSELETKSDGTLKQGTSLISLLAQAQAGVEQVNADSNILDLLKDRNVWPFLINDTYAALNAPHPVPAEVGSDPQAILKIPAGNRRLIQLRNFGGEPSVGEPSAEGALGVRKISVSVLIQLTNADPSRFLNETDGVLDWLKANADRPEAPYIIDVASLKLPQWTKIVGGKRIDEVTAVATENNSSGDENQGKTGTSDASSSKRSGAGAVVKQSREQIQDTGGGFRGGVNSAGDSESQANETAENSLEGTNVSSKRRSRTSVVSAEEKLPSVNLEKEAPLPQSPIMILQNEAQYEGILTFTVILKSSQSVVPPLNADQ